MGGAYRGVGFQLTGRAQLQHGAGGVWDEWYMAFDDGRWGWLAEAQGRFYLTFEHRPGRIDHSALIPGHTVAVGEPPVSMVVAETGEAVLLAGRGEIPYRFEPGHRYSYADLSGQGGAFGTIDFSEQTPTLYLGSEVTLDQLGVSAAAPSREPEHEASPGVAVAAVTCHNCGGSLELHAPDVTERVACPYCGAMHDCNRGVLQFLNVVQGGKIEPDLPLGAQGTFEGHTLTLIGFMRRSIRADGRLYPWDEYLLYHPRVGFRWLVYSDGHWTYVRPVAAGEVDVSVLPNGHHYSGETAWYGGKSYKIFQSGEPCVDHVAGEFYWRVEAGQTAHTVDYVRPPRMLSGESSDGEVNWSLGTYMTRKELDACFADVSPAGNRALGVAPNQPFRHKGVYPVWGLLLVAALVAMFWFSSRAGNRKVYAELFRVEAVTAPESGGQVYFSSPFQLAGGQNIEVVGHGNDVDNSWMYIMADLFHEETGRVYTFDIPIEYYHGYEGGESWSEGGRTKKRYLSAVPAGTYVLRLAVERSDYQRSSAVAIAVSQDVFRWFTWLLALILISLVPACVIAYNIFFEHRRWSQSDYAQFGSGE
jgi:hypothetical protein